MVSALLSLLAAAAPRVAVMPARGGDDVSNHDAQAAIAGALHGVDTIDPDALAHLIASAVASGISCDPSLPECAARIGAFGGLDFVVTTQLTGGRALLALNDCSDGHQVRTVSALLATDARTQGLAALARAVLGKGEAQGQLAIAGHGVIVVDGVEHAAPLTLTLAVGPHDVAWTPARGPTQKRTVDVPAAGVARVAVTSVSPSSTSSSGVALDTLAVGGLAVGGVVAVAGCVGALVAAPGDRAGYSAHDYNDAVTFGRVLLGVAAVGAALAAVAGGALVLGGDP